MNNLSKDRSIQTVIFALGAFALLAAPAAKAGTTPPAKLEHPDVVALVQEPGAWNYRHFPTNLRLYVYDSDGGGKSACNTGCSSVWPPLTARPDAKPTGDWTIIMRDDGRRQWAYKGRPAYVRYHDDPSEPQGDGVAGLWHFLEP